MTNEIISYLELCQREGVNLQKGMNYQIGDGHSVILMSIRPNAPYRDEFQDNGSILIYEGHDANRRIGGPDPKTIDQPELYPSGLLTENGKFHKAALDYINGSREPERVKVYEKLRNGIWSYGGKCVVCGATSETNLSENWNWNKKSKHLPVLAPNIEW